MKELKSLSLTESHSDLESYRPELKSLKIQVVTLMVFWMHVDISLLFQTPDCTWESGPETCLDVLLSNVSWYHAKSAEAMHLSVLAI